jgi:hypothetical protein
VPSAGIASAPGPAPRRGRAADDGAADGSSLERPSESMPITLAGSARRRIDDRAAGAGAGRGSGSISCSRAVGRDTGAGGVSGSAHGSTAVTDRRGCAVPADGVVGAAGRGDVACDVGSPVPGAADGTDRVGALGGAASLRGAGAAGGVAFARAARAAGLSGSKGGGSVGLPTWSGDVVESAGPTACAGAEIGPPLCARTAVTLTTARIAPVKMPDRRPVCKPKTRLLMVRQHGGRQIRRTPLASTVCPSYGAARYLPVITAG